MSVYFVSRHPGAKQWAEEEGLVVDAVVDHLDPAAVQTGDTIIGSLPINLAAQICACGCRYLHLCLVVPRELRGCELTTEQMRLCGARLEEYKVGAKNR
ncbi:MAG: CRISPR-associated protein Csx16 [Desulfuromonadales bacterium]|nr:CRISPR-associated protein Csx16 [Desulfuromonadales bacterium]